MDYVASSAFPRELRRGEPVNLRIAAALNGLTPDDVQVEFIARRVLPRSRTDLPALASFRNRRHDGHWRVMLRPTGESDSDGSQVFELAALPPTSDNSLMNCASAPRTRCWRTRWRWGCSSVSRRQRTYSGRGEHQRPQRRQRHHQ